MSKSGAAAEQNEQVAVASSSSEIQSVHVRIYVKYVEMFTVFDLLDLISNMTSFACVWARDWDRNANIKFR